MLKESKLTHKIFLNNPQYLGNSTRKGKHIFPYWEHKMDVIFSDFSRYNEIIMYGAIGTGKTVIANLCASYILYTTMIIENPQEYFNLSKDDKIVILFLDNNSDKASVKPKIFEYIESSPWFKENGTLTDTEYISNNNIIVKCSDTVKENEKVIACILDEANYIENADKLFTTYKNIKKQMEILFPIFGKCFLVSSSRNKYDLIHTYIEDDIPDTTMLINDTQWTVKPQGTFGTKMFKVMIPTNSELQPIILDDEVVESINNYIEQGYKYLNVPLELKWDFELDVYKALLNLAGITIK